MDRDGAWSLAPAYDVMQGGHPLGGGMRACGVLGKMAEVGAEDLRKLADAHGVRDAAGVIGEVREILGRMAEFGEAVGMGERRLGELESGMRLD